MELDGREEHGTPAAVVVDRRRELTIRDAGFEVIRYGSEQIDHTHEATAARPEVGNVAAAFIAGIERLVTMSMRLPQAEGNEPERRTGSRLTPR